MLTRDAEQIVALVVRHWNRICICIRSLEILVEGVACWYEIVMRKELRVPRKCGDLFVPIDVPD